MSGMETAGIYTDTMEFIGNASPSGPSLGIVYKSYTLRIFLNIFTMLVEEKSTAIVLEHSNSDNWEHDPSNPRRWSLTRKWLSMGTVCDFLPSVSGFIIFFPLGHTLYLCYVLGRCLDGPSPT
jgi:hypothetical protein